MVIGYLYILNTPCICLFCWEKLYSCYEGYLYNTADHYNKRLNAFGSL